MPSQESTSFGQYYLDEKIAQGGMAEIFKATSKDTEGFQKTVVIKKILPHIAANPEFIEMLIDEAKLAVLLSHGNIAQIYDLGKVGADYFIVMEYVDGKSVSQIARRCRSFGKKVPVAVAAYIVAEVANGLDYMHRKTDDQDNPLFIIHRDISPQNIIISTSGTVKIIDFGIAKAKNKISHTDSGVVKGKFAYMSPEHTEGKKLDYRADIFSLGVVLYELVTGQRLFKGKNNADTIRKVQRCKVPTPSAFRGDISRDLDKIIQKILRKGRDKRYQSAHELQLDLTRFLVNHYPDFMPQDLAMFVHNLFAEEEMFGPPPEATKLKFKEEEPAEKTFTRTQDKTIRENGTGSDETLLADPHVMKKRLKDLEAYKLPEPPLPPQTANEEGEGLPIVKEAQESLLARFGPQFFTFCKKISRKLVPLILIVTLGGGIYFAYEKLDLWINTPGDQVKITIPEDNPLPPKTVVTTPEEETPPPPKPTPEQPEEPTGSIVIETHPSGARVFVDDVEMNTVTPTTIENIRAHREHEIGLYMDNYEFFERRVYIEPNAKIKIDVPLKINYGALQVNSLPSGATITLNGRVVGKTPMLLEKINPTTIIRIQLALEKYEDWEKTIKVFAGKKDVINAALDKQSRKR